jgi:hypothetical protein
VGIPIEPSSAWLGIDLEPGSSITIDSPKKNYTTGYSPSSEVLALAEREGFEPSKGF